MAAWLSNQRRHQRFRGGWRSAAAGGVLASA